MFKLHIIVDWCYNFYCVKGLMDELHTMEKEEILRCLSYSCSSFLKLLVKLSICCDKRMSPEFSSDLLQSHVTAEAIKVFLVILNIN